MTSAFSELHWKRNALDRFGLPDIGYPVPVDLLTDTVTSGGEIPFADQLYWLQEYSSLGERDWEALEPAMLRLAELLSEPDDRESAVVAGDSWFLELKSIDLSAATITVQRGDDLLAGIQSRPDGRLAVAIYRALDAKSIRYLLELSCNPNEHGEVCMRPNNWEYALDQAFHTTGALYACGKGEAYLSVWENGLGNVSDGSKNEVFTAQRSISPTPLNLAAAQLGTYYMLSTDNFI